MVSRYAEDILESLSVGVMALDRELRVLSWNSGMESITRITRTKAQGRRFIEVFPSYNGQELEKLIMKAVLLGEPQEVRNLRGVRDDGEAFILRLKISPLCLNPQARSREIIGAIVIAEDVTEKARLGEQLRQLERLKAIGEFAAGIAHELNNPIGIISAHIERLFEKIQRGICSPSEFSRILRIIQEQIQRCFSITQELLRFSRPMDLELSIADMREIVDDMVTFIEPQGRSVGIEIEASLPADPVEVLVDPGQIKQVFLNICLNAFQAMPCGGRLIISIAQDVHPKGVADLDEALGYVCVSFKDTGEGIPPENLSRIFSPFFTTKPNGVGLGLALSHSIMRSHNGTITVESRPGEGAEFTVWLPKAGDF